MKAKELSILFNGCIVPPKEMEKCMNELIKDELTDFLKFLLDNGYCDVDVYSEPPSAIDRYLNPKLNK